MRCFGLLIAGSIIFASSGAVGQAAVQTQKISHGHSCDFAGPDSDAIRLCGLDAAGAGDYDAARKAWGRAAVDGDEDAAEMIGRMYENGDGVQVDYVLAYKWYDIAATIYGREIANMGAAIGPGAAQSNQDEINHRNAVAKYLSHEQIGEAQQLSRQWQAAYLR